VNLAVAIFIVVAATGVAIVAMLWVRRRAPDGSYFMVEPRAQSKPPPLNRCPAGWR
jgi:hypothetical protein